jgi:cytochrome c
MKRLILIAAAASAALAFGSTASAQDGAKLYTEKTCNACHGPTGNKPVLPDYPKIAGQNKAYIVKQMTDIKSGARANGNSAAMKGVMHLVSDKDIEAIADWVSKQKPQ